VPKLLKNRQILADTRLTRDQRQLSGHATRPADAKACQHRHNSIVVSGKARVQPMALGCDFKFLFDELNAKYHQNKAPSESRQLLPALQR
jgi:hypothetical protein